MPKLLFHVCCAPCSGLLSHELKKNSNITVFYDNPNVWPEEEFLRRAQTAEKFFQSEGVEFILTPWDHSAWQKLARGLEHEPEKGRRCKLCYHFRLRNAAEYAASNGFDAFTTSLLISPYKDSRVIKNIGRGLAMKNNLKFIELDLSAVDFRKAVQFAKEQGFYRQKYCGCEYSISSSI